METIIIDGKKVAEDIRAEVGAAVEKLTGLGKRAPKLSVILVGEDPASAVYVRNKQLACKKAGIVSETIRLPEDTTQEKLLSEVRRLNEDDGVDGILVQLPLPKGLNADAVIEAIHPGKDVDGFHSTNVGNLSIGNGRGFFPCTPSGVIELLKRYHIEISGKRCVVVGRSNIVGKPMAFLLLQEDGTVTICHSRTQGLTEILKEADIVVVAVKKPRMIKGDQLKKGAVVIDVGIHRTEEGLMGDVDTESCMGIASAITPVPGGVGPMTIAMLLKNCLRAYEMHEGQA